jgi:hypothetical protein
MATETSGTYRHGNAPANPQADSFPQALLQNWYFVANLPVLLHGFSLIRYTELNVTIKQFLVNLLGQKLWTAEYKGIVHHIAILFDILWNFRQLGWKKA